MVYRKFRVYLREKQLRKESKERRQRAASAAFEQEQKVRALRNGAAPSLRNGHANERQPRQIEPAE